MKALTCAQCRRTGDADDHGWAVATLQVAPLVAGDGPARGRTEMLCPACRRDAAELLDEVDRGDKGQGGNHGGAEG